jgi:hypothetical protein
MTAIRIENTVIQPQIRGDCESWTRTLIVDRWLAKGNLRSIWEQFVVPEGSGNPGAAFAHHPSIHRTEDGDVIFRQSGGLDI